VRARRVRTDGIARVLRALTPALSQGERGRLRAASGSESRCKRKQPVITQSDISLALPVDALAISQLSRHAIEHGLSWSWTPRRVRRSIDDSSTNVVVARQFDRLLGFGIMKYRDEDAHLLLLAVQVAHRRRGVASALYSWLETTARVAGVGSIQLEARARNVGARAFYLGRGFEEIGLREGYYEGVEDAVRLVKRLGGDGVR